MVRRRTLFISLLHAHSTLRSIGRNRSCGSPVTRLLVPLMLAIALPLALPLALVGTGGAEDPPADDRTPQFTHSGTNRTCPITLSLNESSDNKLVLEDVANVEHAIVSVYNVSIGEPMAPAVAQVSDVYFPYPSDSLKFKLEPGRHKYFQIHGIRAGKGNAFLLARYQRSDGTLGPISAEMMYQIEVLPENWSRANGGRPQTVISMQDASPVEEGGTLEFPITIMPPRIVAMTIHYMYKIGDTGAWQVAQTPTIPGHCARPKIRIPIPDNTTLDDDTNVTVKLLRLTNTNIHGNVTATGAVKDNDGLFAVFETSKLEMGNRATASYRFALNRPPDDDQATVSIQPANAGDDRYYTVSPPALTFTQTNWDKPQKVTVTGRGALPRIMSFSSTVQRIPLAHVLRDGPNQQSLSYGVTKSVLVRMDHYGIPQFSFSVHDPDDPTRHGARQATIAATGVSGHPTSVDLCMTASHHFEHGFTVHLLAGNRIPIRGGTLELISPSGVISATPASHSGAIRYASGDRGECVLITVAAGTNQDADSIKAFVQGTAAGYRVNNFQPWNKFYLIAQVDESYGRWDSSFELTIIYE